MHKRTEIRNALVSLLTGTAPTYATDADNRIYANRIHPLKTLPAIRIFDENESAMPLDMASSRYTRKLLVKIEACVSVQETYDTEMDDLAQQIEDAISTNRKLSGKCLGMVLQSTEFTMEPGEKPVAVAALTYEIQYIY